jgi:hypothetical protein
MKRSTHGGNSLFTMVSALIKRHRWTIWTSIVLVTPYAIQPADANAMNKYSLSMSISPGIGLSTTKVLCSSGPAFSFSRPLYNLTLGTDIAGAYRINRRFTLSLRNSTDWYHPGFTTMLNNNTLLESTYDFSGTPEGYFAGLGAGIGVLVYPFDSYWNSHYGAWGFSTSLFAGYAFGNRIGLSLHTIASFPQNRNNVIPDIQNPSDVILQYVFINSRFMITYNLF